MYRQIDVHPDDRRFQLILWRENTDDPINTYQLTTLTYGTTPAAYIATKCLQVIAKEIENTSPEIAFAISSEFYMDNLLTGANTHEDAIEKASKIHAALMNAQFPLRKYLSNSEKFLANIDSTLKEPLRPVSFTSSGATKMLGLQWHPVEDEFRVDVNPVDVTNITLTKRVISSLIASTFDPLGFVAPVTIRGKILLQDLWREELSWDDTIPEEIQRKFREYYTDLNSLPRFAIRRPYSTEKSEKFDIIGFCDASERAYGAVVYVKTNSRTSIVCAKTKVAPVKTITIPRLELLGAVLLVRLLEKVSNVLEFNIQNAHVFCDSTIVLAWLKNTESKLEVFVRNRVNFINERLLREQWNHVKTDENPADLITRGISVKTLVESSLWSNGPTWLTQELKPIEVNSTRVELSQPIERFALVTCEVRDESLFTRYSNFDRLIRVTSQMCRFLRKLRPALSKFDELNESTRALYVLCTASQHAWFENEISTLRSNSTLSTRSPLAALDPFIDKYGVLRVGGRLRQSSLSHDTKHPIVLHSKSQFAVLYVRHIHGKYWHASRAFTSAYVRSRFWLIGGTEKLVKKTFYQCVWCTRMKAETSSQIMGDLPNDRTTISRPFTVSGVDFAGPFQIKCTNHRTYKYVKHYAAFFVCFTTRAVHIESVADLSTESFIAALKRFVARRGVPNTLWSDNGTNFVGAKNFLLQQCDRLGANWKFIPPKSPNHGGIWESAVKAGKKLLVSAAKGATLSEDEFKTTLAQVEAILNSRPMYRSRKTSDPDEIDIITPGHYLVGSNLLQPETYDYGREPLQKRLLAYQQIVSSFWRSWKKNYIAQLQRRSKWKSAQSDVKIGDVVLMKIDSTPLRWPLAKVINVLPDHRGKVRILTLKCGDKDYTRTVQQIVRIPEL